MDVKKIRELLTTSGIVRSVEETGSVEDAVLETTLSIEEAELTTPELKATQYALEASKDPGAAFNRYAETATESAQLPSIFTEDSLNYGDVEYGIEAFSDTNVDNIAVKNVAYNINAAKQGEFGDGFFPVVVYPVGTGSVKVNVDVPYFTKTKLHNTGSTAGRQLTSLIKSVIDADSPFNKDTNRLWPVVGVKDEFDNAFFYVADKYNAEDDETGTIIETAPLLGGKVIPVKDVSQSAAQLVNGTLTTDDILAKEIALEKLGFKVSDTETVYVSVDGLLGSKTTDTPSGSRNEEVQLSLTNPRFELRPKALKTIKGDVATAFDKLPANYSVVYDVDITGKGNVVEGTFALYVNRFDVVAIKDASGNIVPESDANYADYKADAEKLGVATFKSFVARFALTNTSLKREGLRVTIKESVVNFNIQPKTPFTVITAIKDLAGKDSDAKMIPELIRLTKIQTEKNAISIVEKIIERFKSLQNQGIGIATAQLGGLSGLLTYNYFKEITVDLKTEVNSFDDATRAEAIKGKLVNAIRSVVGDMITATGYKEVIAGMRDTVDVVIGTSVAIATYLNGEINLGAGIRAKVVATSDLRMKGKIRVAFTNWNSDRYDAIDPTIFGNLIYTPALVADYQGTTADGAKARIYSVLPHLEYVTGLPAIAAINVNNLEESY